MKMRLNLAALTSSVVVTALLSSALTPVLAQEADEVSPACGDYQRNVILVDGFVNSPTTVTLDQLRSMPDQATLNIDFVDRLGTVQHHSESGPLLWTVLDAAGGVQVPPLRAEQYQGPNPFVTLYVIMIAVNGYQSLVSEAEIDPNYGHARILVAHTEDGKPMLEAPYAATNKAPAQLVVPGDTRGGRYENRICRISVQNGELGEEAEADSP
jgi:hypothetical protein